MGDDQPPKAPCGHSPKSLISPSLPLGLGRSRPGMGRGHLTPCREAWIEAGGLDRGRSPVQGRATQAGAAASWPRNRETRAAADLPPHPSPLGGLGQVLAHSVPTLLAAQSALCFRDSLLPSVGRARPLHSHRSRCGGGSPSGSGVGEPGTMGVRSLALPSTPNLVSF